jgi:hypothetical protein
MPNRSLEGTLRKYLLGDLRDPARLDVEERVIAQPEMFDALALAEQALIDDYLDDTLPGTERARFERQLSAVTGLRQRVQFARRLRAHAAAAEIGSAGHRLGAAGDASGWVLPVVGRIPTWRPPAWAYRPAWAAMVAALLVAAVAAGVWLERDRVRREARLEQLRTAQHENQQQLEVLRSTVRDLQGQLEAEQRERARLASAAVEPLRAVAAPLPPVPTFLLATGVLRSEGALSRIAVPAGAQLVRLRLADDRRYGEYRARLLDAEGEELWSVSRLRADPDGSNVTVVLPADVLPRGDYQLTLGPAGREPAAEGTRTYTFRVTARP